jgi:hypothetical protein
MIRFSPKTLKTRFEKHELAESINTTVYSLANSRLPLIKKIYGMNTYVGFSENANSSMYGGEW